MSVCTDYSGVVLNQNAIPTGWHTPTATIYQTFHLPSDFSRGTNESEIRIPSLSGLQVFCQIAQGLGDQAQIQWSLSSLNASGPWLPTTAASGTTTGTYTDNGPSWFDIIFAEPVPVTAAQLSDTWIIALTFTDIAGVAYTSPTNTFGQAYSAFSGNVQTSLITPSCTLAFRVLALIADSGTDILGDPYRSVMVSTPGQNLLTQSGALSVGGIGHYWMSQALPDSSAVCSLYFDMRDTSSATIYDLINYVDNPSFEHDVVGSPPRSWTLHLAGATQTNFEVVNAIPDHWAYEGANSLYVSLSGLPASATAWLGGNNINVTPGSTWSGSGVFNVDSPGTACSLQFQWMDADGNNISNIDGNYITSGVGTSQIVGASPPSGASILQPRITITNNSASTESVQIYLDAICVTPTPTVSTYFDGDSTNCIWLGQFDLSYSARVSTNQLGSNAVVVDALVFDPLTPNIAFNLYYSNDDSTNTTPMTPSNWESKLWTRVPRVFRPAGKQTLVLPSPINARYIKIELTNPQPQSYTPNIFQLPISYKTFPSWVQNYFYNQVQYDPYIADDVIVQSNALTTLYSPSVNDLIEQPDNPIALPTSPGAPATEEYDSTTLSQIGFPLGQFQTPVGTDNPQTITGQITTSMSNGAFGSLQQSTEAAPVTYPDITTVSSSQRDDVLIEALRPPMYFFYTCRHAYMEMTATLSQNVAYFFGVNQVSFLRYQGAIPSDSVIYTETGIDYANAQLNDFVVAGNEWDTYAS